MNASYKIALVVAVGLLIVVVGYYATRGSADITGTTPPALDAAAVALDDAPANTPGTDTPRNAPGTRTPRAGDDTPPTVRDDRPTPAIRLDLETVTPRQPRTVELGPAPGEPLDPTTGGNDATTTPNEPVETDPATAQPTPGEQETQPAQPAGTPDPQPAPRTTPPTRQAGDVPETYTVKPGDMLVTIAERLYGTQTAWEAIAQANPSVDPTRLRVGQELRLPPRSAVNRPRQEQPAPPPGERERYTVQPGDNLSRIAERFYGSAEHWEIIYNHNRDAIGADPGRLRAGMTLDIPPALPERG